MADLDPEVLPSSWATAPITEVAQCRMGTTILAKDLTETGTPVYSAGTDNRPWGFLANPVRVFGHETVVLSARGTIGAAKIPAEPAFTSTQTTITASFPSPSLARWAQPYLRTVDWANRQAGNAIPMLTIGMLSEVLLPLAPEAEQRRIVAKLDALQSRTRLAREALAAIPALLDHYRQSVLAAAFRGELTADWRTLHAPTAHHWPSMQTRKQGGRLQSAMDAADEARDSLGEIPAEWAWGSLSQIVDVHVGYAFDSKSFRPAGGIRYLRGINIGHGKTRWDDAAWADDKDLRGYEGYLLQEGDVILAMDRPLISTGLKWCVLSKEDMPAALVQRVACLRPKAGVPAALVTLYLNSPVFLGYLRLVATGTQLPHISQTDIELAPFPLCGPPEMSRIVERIGSGTSKWTDLALLSQRAEQELGHLDQSLLATAFRGELVPQDPADEPASVLLDRIRAVRAQAGDIPRTRRSKSTGMDGRDGMKPSASISPSHASHPSQSTSDSTDPYATLLSALRTQGSLASADAQAATGLDAAGVRPLLQRLVAEGAATVEGQKRGTRYVAT